jgi:hypothetical protein
MGAATVEVLGHPVEVMGAASVEYKNLELSIHCRHRTSMHPSRSITSTRDQSG